MDTKMEKKLLRHEGIMALVCVAVMAAALVWGRTGAAGTLSYVREGLAALAIAAATLFTAHTITELEKLG